MIKSGQNWRIVWREGGKKNISFHIQFSLTQAVKTDRGHLFLFSSEKFEF